MSSYIKRTPVLVMGLMLTSYSHAAMLQHHCRPGHVTVPCEATAIDLGIELGWMQATSGPNWVYQQTVQNSGSTTTYERQSSQLDHTGSMRLEGSYHYDSGNDISVIWTHYRNDDSHISQSVNSGYTSTSPYLHDIFFDSVNTNNVVKFDSVNLEMGQLAHYGNRYRVRTHYGFQWAQVSNDITENVTIDTENTLFTTNAVHYCNNSRFRGLGLRGGLDTGYELGNGFSIEGNAGAAILVGNLKSRSSITVPGYIVSGEGEGEGEGEEEGPGEDENSGEDHYPGDEEGLQEEELLPQFHNELDNLRGDMPQQEPALVRPLSDSRRVIVPELDAQVALKYQTEVSRGVIDIRLGWRITQYFNVIETTLESVSGDNVNYLGSGNSTETRAQINNFAVNGPFLGIRWIG